MRNMRRSRARCLCGLRATLHFHPVTHVKLTCDDARKAHPSATVRPVSFLEALQTVALRKDMR